MVYAHPCLEPVLKRTLGVPLFQEQVIRMSMMVAGFTGGQAEELRRALGMKRSMKRMAEVEVKLREGMRRNGITGKTADEIVGSITSFALYGFPESHAASFALLAYASAYLKCHYATAYTCALLNNQPMGFYSPFTVVKDAQRHGVRFRAVDVTTSDWNCALEQGELRLGLRYVRGLRKVAADRLLAERTVRAFASLQDMVDRAALHRDELTALAEVGALNAFGLTRRSALWQVERALRDADAVPDPSPLSEMTLPERLHTDIVGTTFTIGPHPMIVHREGLAARGIRRAWDLRHLREGTRLTVAGAVVCRQRPATAKGFLFLTLEDETGLANVIVRPDLYDAHAAVWSRTEALEIDGILQTEGGLSVRAIAVRPLQVPPLHTTSHDFH